VNRPVIAIAAEGSSRQRKREAPRGRRVQPEARAAVRELLGDAPRRGDLLIEHLHKLQDRFGHLSSAHLAALADEMKLAQAEVFEVATF
jgi:formate dehydrogenase